MMRGEKVVARGEESEANEKGAREKKAKERVKDDERDELLK